MRSPGNIQGQSIYRKTDLPGWITAGGSGNCRKRKASKERVVSVECHSVEIRKKGGRKGTTGFDN